MSANHSLILFEGDVTKKFSGIFDCFGLKLIDDTERANGLSEIWEYTGWPRRGRPRNHIHKAALFNGMWTAILDREMTMILNQEQCMNCAKQWEVKIFGYMIEAISGSCALYYFTPEKVRGLNVQNFEVLEDFGAPLPQEEGITTEEMLGDGAMRVSRRMGFSDSLFAHPASKVLILAIEDPQREAADQERSGILASQQQRSGILASQQQRSGIYPPQKQGSGLRPPQKKAEGPKDKPWWKFW